MKKILFASVFLVILVSSCKKKTPDIVIISKFMSYTAGNTWNYQTIDNTTQVVTPYILTTTAIDTPINSKSYRIFNYTDSLGTTEEYYNNTDNDYFQYAQLSPQLPPMELKYLNDAAEIGTTWSQPFSITQNNITLTANLISTILDKGITEVVNNVTYTNVIKVKTEIVNLTSDNPLIFNASVASQNIVTCFAPRVGLIKREFALHITSVFFSSQSQDLINSNTTNRLMSSNIQ